MGKCFSVPSAREPTKSYQDYNGKIKVLETQTQKLEEALKKNQNELEKVSCSIVLLRKQIDTDKKDAHDLQDRGLKDEANKKALDAQIQEGKYYYEINRQTALKEEHDELAMRCTNNKTLISMLENQLNASNVGVSLEDVQKLKDQLNASRQRANDMDNLLRLRAVPLNNEPAPNPYSAMEALLMRERSLASQASGNQKNFSQGQGDPQQV
jgi:chromosome segregation ATPase